MVRYKGLLAKKLTILGLVFNILSPVLWVVYLTNEIHHALQVLASIESPELSRGFNFNVAIIIVMLQTKVLIVQKNVAILQKKSVVCRKKLQYSRKSSNIVEKSCGLQKKSYDLQRNVVILQKKVAILQKKVAILKKKVTLLRHRSLQFFKKFFKTMTVTCLNVIFLFLKIFIFE